MFKKIVLWSAVTILIGAGIFFLGRLSFSQPASQGPPAFSLSQGPISMLGGGAGYVFDYASSSSYEVATTEELVQPIQRYLDQLGNPDLAVARLREFQWAYQAEIVERSTGRHAFGLMMGKGSFQFSPKAGPNIFWNTQYGSLIAEVGGGYGMLGRLLSQDSSKEMSVSETQARAIAQKALQETNVELALDQDLEAFYGFYEFHVLEKGELVGELDVNGYSGQVWYKDWGEPQIKDIPIP